MSKTRNAENTEAAPAGQAPDRAANEISESLFGYRFAELGLNADNQRLWRTVTDDWRTCRQWQAGEGWVSGPEARTLAVNQMDALIISECQAKQVSAGRWASRKAGNAALALAAAYPGVLTPSEQWDSDPATLGLPGARKVHLSSGETSDQRAADLISAKTAIAPDPDCPIPNFMRVIEHMSGGDSDLAAFYREAIGASLYGHNEGEQAYFWHGGGASGKSTLWAAILAALGQYGARLNAETLEGDRNQHLTFLASLRGRRIAVVSEMEGSELRMARFKALVGGDELMVNRMRENPEPFRCNATIHAMANPDCLPSLRQIDEAIRRRIVIVPAGESVPEAERDPAVKRDILARELPGVLQWAIDGALDYSGSLALPGAVTEATELYFAEASPVARWIDEHCEQGAFETPAAELRIAFVAWWQSMRFSRTVPNRTAFGRDLTRLGFEKRKTGGNIVRSGLRPL